MFFNQEVRQSHKSRISLADAIPLVHGFKAMISKTSITPERLATTLDIQTEMLREEQERTAEIDRRMGEMQRAIADLARQRDESTKRQAAFSQSIIYTQDLLRLAKGAPSEPGPVIVANETDRPSVSRTPIAEGKPKLVARLGDQHYRMLYALRAKGPLSLDELAQTAVTPPRRVKAQMAEDAEADREIVASNGEKYELTPIGADLLQRFEDFRRLMGRELPALDAPQNDADGDEADHETPKEGDEG